MDFETGSHIMFNMDVLSVTGFHDLDTASQPDFFNHDAWMMQALGGAPIQSEMNSQPADYMRLNWTEQERADVRSILSDYDDLNDFQYGSVVVSAPCQMDDDLARKEDACPSEEVLEDEESTSNEEEESTDDDEKEGPTANGEQLASSDAEFFDGSAEWLSEEIGEEGEEEVLETGAVYRDRSFLNIIHEWMNEMTITADIMIKFIPHLAEISRESLVEALSCTLGMVNHDTLIISYQQWELFFLSLKKFLVKTTKGENDLCSISSPVLTESPQQSKVKWRVTFETEIEQDRKFIYRPVHEVVHAIMSALVENKKPAYDSYASHPMVVLMLARMVRDLTGETGSMAKMCGVPETSVAYAPELYCYMMLNRLPVKHPWGSTPDVPYAMNSQEVFLALAHACSTYPIWQMTDALTKVGQCYDGSTDMRRSINNRIRTRKVPAVPSLGADEEYREIARSIYDAVGSVHRGQDAAFTSAFMSVLDAAAIGCYMRSADMMKIRTVPYRYSWVGCHESTAATDGEAALRLASSGVVRDTMADHLGLDSFGRIRDGCKLLLFPTAVPTMLMECLEETLPIVQDALRDPSFQFRMYHASGMSVVAVPESVVGLLRAALYTATHRSTPINTTITNHGNDGFITTAIMQDSFQEAQISENTIRARVARRTFLCGFFMWLNIVGNKTHRCIKVERVFNDYDALFFSVRNILIFLPAAVLPSCAGDLDGPRLMRNTIKVLTNMIRFSRTPSSEFHATARAWIERIIGSFFAIVEMYSSADPTGMGSFWMETEVFLNIANIILESNDPYIMDLENTAVWVKATIASHPVYTRTEAPAETFEIDQKLALCILDIANNLQLIPTVAATRARIYTSFRFMRSDRTDRSRAAAQLTFDMFSPKTTGHGALFWPCFAQAVACGDLHFYRSYTDDMDIKFGSAIAPRTESAVVKRILVDSVRTEKQTYYGSEAVLEKPSALVALRRDDFIHTVFSLFEHMTCPICASGAPCQGSRVQYMGAGAQLKALPVSVYHNTEKVVYDTYGHAAALVRGSNMQAFSAFSPGVSGLGAAAIANCTLFRDATLYPTEKRRKRSRDEN